MESPRYKLIYPYREAAQGALAGAIATLPMSLAMLLGWRLLPKPERYPLPPREITGEIAERLVPEGLLREDVLNVASVLAHFGYGAAFGSAYGLLERGVRQTDARKGVGAGILLWIGSYLGWLPGLRILKPATRHPWRRNLMMIVAHLVWGLALGEVFRRLRPAQRYLNL